MAPGLQFRIRDFRDELTTLGQIAGTFFAPGWEAAFRRLETQIDSLWDYPDRGMAVLQIDGSAPLRTRPSAGLYEHKGGGTFKSLHADFGCVWRVRVGGPPSRKASANRWFEIAGEASTVTELWVDPSEDADRFSPEVPTPCCVASWRLEIGNMSTEGSASPGPLFHTQLPRREAVAPLGAGGLAPGNEMWPHWLSVPRLHGLPFTPMLAIEFGLAEVFQEEWAEHVRSTGSHGTMVKHWAKVQRTRLQAFFDWQRDAVGRPDAATPLVGLKERGMPVGLLVAPT